MDDEGAEGEGGRRERVRVRGIRRDGGGRAHKGVRPSNILALMARTALTFNH